MILERVPVVGILASSSIVLSAAYTIYMFNRISLGGSFSMFLEENPLDITLREFLLLFTLILITVLLGIYPNLVLDGVHNGIAGLAYGVIPFNL